MNLLLLLSAMLSALTGIGSSARVPESAAIAGKIEVAPVARNVAVARVSRPVQTMPALDDVALMPMSYGVTPTGYQPLYASRRRE